MLHKKISNIWKIYENWIFKIFNWTKGCLEENKKSFENGAPIFEYSFNDKWMNRRKIGLFSIYNNLIRIFIKLKLQIKKYQICDIIKINWTKDWLEEDKESFKDGATIFWKWRPDLSIISGWIDERSDYFQFTTF